MNHKLMVLESPKNRSYIVRFLSSFPEWRGIDFEHSVEVGEEIPSHHGFTVLYAPPELVRWLYGSSSGGGRLMSSKSMDMWSVGVCLMEIASGEDFFGVKNNKRIVYS